MEQEIFQLGGIVCLGLSPSRELDRERTRRPVVVREIPPDGRTVRVSVETAFSALPEESAIGGSGT